MSLQIYDYYLNGARKMGENCEKQPVGGIKKPPEN